MRATGCHFGPPPTENLVAINTQRGVQKGDYGDRKGDYGDRKGDCGDFEIWSKMDPPPTEKLVAINTQRGEPIFKNFGKISQIPGKCLFRASKMSK